MVPLLAFVLAAATPTAAPAQPPGPRVTALGQAVAVILPVATTAEHPGQGGYHRRIRHENGAVIAVYE